MSSLQSVFTREEVMCLDAQFEESCCIEFESNLNYLFNKSDELHQLWRSVTESEVDHLTKNENFYEINRLENEIHLKETIIRILKENDSWESKLYDLNQEIQVIDSKFKKLNEKLTNF